jgi:hypothetical protein
MKDLHLNQVLWTKDGREIGNAIVIKIFDSGSIQIKTDYGNIVRLTKKEVDHLFYYKKEGLTSEEHELISKTHKYAIKK